jgi:hypothetical protein
MWNYYFQCDGTCNGPVAVNAPGLIEATQLA